MIIEVSILIIEKMLNKKLKIIFTIKKAGFFLLSVNYKKAMVYNKGLENINDDIIL